MKKTMPMMRKRQRMPRMKKTEPKRNPELESTLMNGGSVFMLLGFLGGMVPAWGLYKGVGWMTIHNLFFKRLFDFDIAFPNFFGLLSSPDRFFNALQQLFSF